MENNFAFQKMHLRTKEAAEYLGLSKSSLEKMRFRGESPLYAKLGRIVVYDVGDLDAWVNIRKRTSTFEMSAGHVR